MAMIEKLHPCPFCEGIPAIAGIVTPEHKLAWRLRLGKGQCEEYATVDAAHEAWNKRVREEREKR